MKENRISFNQLISLIEIILDLKLTRFFTHGAENQPLFSIT